MTLAKNLKVLQELIFQSTIKDSKNWIRFPKNGKIHLMIGRGAIEGISLADISPVGEDLMEIRT